MFTLQVEETLFYESSSNSNGLSDGVTLIDVA